MNHRAPTLFSNFFFSSSRRLADPSIMERRGRWKEDTRCLISRDCSSQPWVTHENILKNKLWHQLPSNTDTLRRLSLPLIPPACSASVVVRFLRAAWASLLSSTCLLNDNNYFPACFISTSTFPICLYGHHRHPSPVLEGRNPAGVSVLPGSQGFPLGVHVPLWGVFYLVGQKTRMD